jgi:hypothetical protein
MSLYLYAVSSTSSETFMFLVVVGCNSDETQPHFLLLSPHKGWCLYR